MSCKQESSSYILITQTKIILERILGTILQDELIPALE